MDEFKAVDRKITHNVFNSSSPHVYTLNENFFLPADHFSSTWWWFNVTLNQSRYSQVSKS